MNVTAEQITQAVAIYGIHRYVVRECSICNSPLSYVFSPDGLQAAFDGACDCSSWHPPEPRDLENVAEHFNRQSEEVRAELWIQFTASGDGRKPLEFGYTNHRGEYGARRVAPLGVWFGSTEYHPEPQWLLKGIDLDKNAERDFALKDFGIGESKVAQAYQVIGMLLGKTGDFGTEEGQRALDYFSEERSYSDDFLPWPRGNHDEWEKAGRVGRLTDTLTQMKVAAEVAISALPEDQRGGAVGEFLASIRDFAGGAVK